MAFPVAAPLIGQGARVAGGALLAAILAEKERRRGLNIVSSPFGTIAPEPTQVEPEPLTTTLPVQDFIEDMGTRFGFAPRVEPQSTELPLEPFRGFNQTEIPRDAVPFQEPVLRQEKPKKLNRVDGAFGMFGFTNDEIGFFGGTRTQGLSSTRAGTKLNFPIYDTTVEGGKLIGDSDLVVDDNNEVIGITNFEINKAERGQGKARKAIEALRETFPETALKVNDVGKSKVKFWEKLGAKQVGKRGKGAIDMEFPAIETTIGSVTGEGDVLQSLKDSISEEIQEHLQVIGAEKQINTHRMGFNNLNKITNDVIEEKLKEGESVDVEPIIAEVTKRFFAGQNTQYKGFGPKSLTSRIAKDESLFSDAFRLARDFNETTN